MDIPVVWTSYHQPAIINRGYWDQALLEEFLEGYDHRASFGNIKGGAVVIVNGRTHVEDIARLNKDISKLTWCLFIVTGDEEGLFPITEIKHERLKAWVQLPRVTKHDHVYKLPNGYRPTTRQILRQIGLQERSLDWFFAGQINHGRRSQCRDILGQMTGGELVETHSFGDEKLNYTAYLTKLAGSKVAPCPSGVESPDNFRLYEALEAGCIPVVDAYSTNNPVPGFWKYLLGDDIPFPVISEWTVFPSVLRQLLKDYPNNANKVFAWWLLRKSDIKHRLEEDIKELWM